MERVWQERLQVFLRIALAAMVLYFIVEHFLFLLFPVALAWLFSEAIRRSFCRLKPISPVGKRILIVLILLIFFAILSLLFLLLAEKLVQVVSATVTTLAEKGEGWVSVTQDRLRDVEAWLSRLFRREMAHSLTANFPALFSSWLERVLEWVPQWAYEIARFFPKFFLSLFIFILSTYYFSCDWERFSAFFKKRLAPERLQRLRQLREKLVTFTKQYFKAYFILFLITFSELFFAFSLLRVASPATKALLVAAVDILPVLGCGTFLLPWSIFLLISGRITRGLAVLGLYLVMTVFRQILEPKILGRSMGLHPVVSLILVILGLQIFGFFGMILFPLVGACFNQELRAEKK